MLRLVFMKPELRAFGILQMRASAHQELAAQFPAAERNRFQWRWRLRRWQGKILSVLRLSKAAFTFQDSISYAAWKIERHTGVRVEVTPLLRRHPVLWGVKVSWQLLRRGVMR